MKLDTETKDNSAVGSPRSARPKRKGLIIAVLSVALLGGLWTLGYLPRAARTRQLTTGAQRQLQSVPSVTVVPAKEAPAEMEISLPGATIQAEMETPVFARADGYVKRWLADIGDRVKAGQILAEIDSPELDQQIRETEAGLKRAQSAWRQAQAAHQQALANLRLAEVTAKRWETLVAKGVLSKQDGDEKRSAYEARQADAAAAEANVQAAGDNIAAAEATLQRLRELQSFCLVRAPFKGVITARNVDVGTLVTAGSASSLREMFRIAQIETLRVFVNVPQSEAPSIRRGLPCLVEVEEYRGRRFPGQVSRTSNSLDPASRTLLTEVQIQNPGGLLLPGMYATVRFKLLRENPPLLIPSAAFRNTAKGPIVATLRDGSRIHIVPVKLGRDYGAEIEVLEGLKAGQEVITNLTDEIAENAQVRRIAPPKPSAVNAGGRSQ